jgi:hypothetical protein
MTRNQAVLELALFPIIMLAFLVSLYALLPTGGVQ